MKSDHWRIRASFCVLYALFLLLLAEIGARAFWSTHGLPFFTAQRRIHLSFYPMLSSLERRYRLGDGDFLDVLLLGGSAMHTDFGDIEHVLRERLSRRSERRVRVFNVSAPAHTTRDSYFKYKHLDGKKFDLVVVYHGINEVRANNCPRQDFREDYSHFSWYKLLNDYERKAGSRWLAFPYTAEFIAVRMAVKMGRSHFLPTHDPDPESVEYGCDLKTAASFTHNLEGILEMAAQRGQRVALMTFAYYLPDDYTRERFDEGKLDYTVHMYPAELWGKPECVAAGISSHNQAVRKVAQTAENAIFVDLDALIPKNARYFNDICHLTHEGCESFVENLLDALGEQLDEAGRESAVTP